MPLVTGCPWSPDAASGDEMPLVTGCRHPVTDDICPWSPDAASGDQGHDVLDYRLSKASGDQIELGYRLPVTAGMTVVNIVYLGHFTEIKFKEKLQDKYQELEN